MEMKSLPINNSKLHLKSLGYNCLFILFHSSLNIHNFFAPISDVNRKGSISFQGQCDRHPAISEIFPNSLLPDPNTV